MRGQIPSQPGFVSLINVETLIAADHPIRRIKRLCDEALRTAADRYALSLVVTDFFVVVDFADLAAQRFLRDSRTAAVVCRRIATVTS